MNVYTIIPSINHIMQFSSHAIYNAVFHHLHLHLPLNLHIGLSTCERHDSIKGRDDHSLFVSIRFIIEQLSGLVLLVVGLRPGKLTL